MKSTFTTLASVLLFTALAAQQMHIEQPDFKNFPKDKKQVTALLEKNSSAQAKAHPEYGNVPFNAQCSNCVELLDKRTEDSRFFIDKDNPGYVYAQQSYFPLHYRQAANDVWRTIDFRLQPDIANPGVYIANNQPAPTACNLNRKSTSINLGETQFEFNRNISLSFYQAGQLVNATGADYSSNTIGQQGLEVQNAWPGINMQQIFSTGTIETNYVITRPINIPVADGFMVIEDHFTLPVGYSFVEASPGNYDQNGFYKGDYDVLNTSSKALAVYKRPVFVDAKGFGMQGGYKLIKSGNDYSLQLFVPVSWLNRTENVYPLTIDPLVYALTRIGNFSSTGQTPYPFGFTSAATGSCDKTMTVNVPGKIQLTRVLCDIEYHLTYNHACDSTQPIQYCTFNQVSLRVKNTDCNTSSGLLGCFETDSATGGFCTTDSDLVAGAHAEVITDSVADYIGCFSPQCDNYALHFTLQAQDSVCSPEVCGFLCAEGNTWQMTVEGHSIEETSSSATPDTVCPGQAVALTEAATYGVPPYKYRYIIFDGQQLIDTTLSAPDFTFHPAGSTTITAIVSDSCNVNSTSHLAVTINTPQIIVQHDTLFAPDGTSFQWYLNDTAIVGAIGPYYVVTREGNYTVSLANYLCISRPVFIHIIVNGINEVPTIGSWSVVPNPSNGQFVIKLNSAIAGSALMRLIDNTGRVVVQQPVEVTEGTNTLQFNKAGTLAKGLYLVEIEQGRQKMQQRLIIE